MVERSRLRPVLLLESMAVVSLWLQLPQEETFRLAHASWLVNLPRRVAAQYRCWLVLVGVAVLFAL